MDGGIDGPINELADRWTDEQMDGWISGRVNGWMDRHFYTWLSVCIPVMSKADPRACVCECMCVKQLRSADRLSWRDVRQAAR